MKALNLQSVSSPKTNPQVSPMLPGMAPSIHDEMKSLKQCFMDNNPITISTPFQGTALAITNDGSKYIFSSKESRIAVCDSRNRRLILDKQVKEKEIWTLVICKNDSIVLVGGTSGVIRKLQFPTLREIEVFTGHTNEINYILVSHDDEFVFSCSDDCSVRKWPLNQANPTSQVLYNHKGRVLGMALSSDSSMVATTSEDSSMIVYKSTGSLTDEGTILNTLTTPSGNSLWICRFSPDSSLVVAGSQDGCSYVWKTSSWELIKVLSGHKDRVRCMNFSKSGSILITGSIDTTIRVWDMKGNKDSIHIDVHTGWVRATNISESGQFCISLGDDRKIIRWKIPDFERIISLVSDNSNVLVMWVKKDSSRVYAINDNYLIRIWDTHTGELLTNYQLETENILHFTVSGDTEHLYLFYKEENTEEPENPNLRVHLLNVETGSLVKDFHFKYFEITSSFATADEQFVIIGTNYTVDIYDKNFNLFHNFRSHSSKVITIRTTSDSKYLFTASVDGELIMSNIPEKKMVKKLLRPDGEQPVTLIRISNNNELLIAAHLIRVDFISISKQSKIMTLNDPGVKNVSFTHDNSKAIFFERNSLSVYNMDNFSLYYKQVFIVPTSYITIAPNKQFWVLYRGQNSKIVPNPLNGEHFDCVGKRGEEALFKKYLMDIIRDKEPKHNKNFDKWIVLPNGMNTAHFYAYYNMPNYLLRAYEEGASFFPSKSGHTPLSIALELKYLSCVRAIIKGLTRLMQNNPLTIFYFDRSLTQLNNLGYSGLHGIYGSMFNRSINRSLPKFSFEKPPQIYIESPNLLPDKTDFMPEDSYSNDGYSIIFKQSYCRFPLVPGSKESLEFINSLINCTNNKIYDTEIIKLLLEEKWKKSHWIMFFIAFIFLSFSILLALHTIIDRNDKTFIYGPFIVECILILYELIQLYINKLEYFKDILNWVDIVKTVLFMAYFVLVQIDERENNSLLAIVLFITLFRGITFFRLFSETRKYINLLYEVVFDLVPFLIIFYYSAVGFAMIFLSLDRESESDFFKYVSWGYPTDLPNYDSGMFEDDKAEWLNYFLVTLLISIVMLSLVVSILSDTYGRVSSHAQVADSQALAQMIYECELLFFWNRNKSESKFVFLCSELEDPTLEKVDVMEKVGKLKNLVTALAKKINSNRRLMRQVKADFVEDSTEIVKSLNELT